MLILQAMKSIRNKTSLIIDLFFCVVYMPLLAMLGPGFTWLNTSPWFFIVACLFLYASYFGIKWLNVPKRLIERQYPPLIYAAFALTGCAYLLTLYPLPELDFVTPSMSRYQTRLRDWSVSLSTWLVFSLVVGYALTTSFVRELYGQLILKQEIEAQRDSARLAMFKAQISPHFLFNTLNSLYSLVIGTSEKAEDAFIKFTELLKYTYTTIDNEEVPVIEEINYIDNYIDLQKIRLNSHTSVIWDFEVDCEETPIPPMLMLTFVENAFKYGSSTSHDCEIRISLRLKEGKLTFRTRNNIMRHADEFRVELPKGIENCRARLAGIFPGRHSLVTSEKENIFRLQMDINLNHYDRTNKMHSNR